MSMGWVSLDFNKAKKNVKSIICPLCTLIALFNNLIVFMNVSYLKVYSDYLPVSFLKKPLKYMYPHI